MTLENQVTSLEISKRLKELGVKQKSIFGWYNRKKVDGKGGEFDSWEIYLNDDPTVEYEIPFYSAFTVAELIELLGNKLGVIDHFKNGEWGAYIPNDIGVSATGKYLPDVLAELLMRVTDMEDYEES